LFGAATPLPELATVVCN